jgi:hypothetical protein
VWLGLSDLHAFGCSGRQYANVLALRDGDALLLMVMQMMVESVVLVRVTMSLLLSGDRQQVGHIPGPSASGIHRKVRLLTCLLACLVVGRVLENVPQHQPAPYTCCLHFCSAAASALWLMLVTVSGATSKNHNLQQL